MKEKQLAGTLRKDRIVKAIGMEPVKELPTAPGYFTEYEKEFFDRISLYLFEAGILRGVDILLIEMHAMWWHVYKTNRALVCAKATQETDKGYNQITGTLTAVERAAKNLQWFSEKYGLNLISKDKIAAPVKKSSELDDIMN